MFPNRRMGLDNYMRLVVSLMLLVATGISGYDLGHVSMTFEQHATLLGTHIFFAVMGITALAITIYSYLKGK